MKNVIISLLLLITTPVTAKEICLTCKRPSFPSVPQRQLEESTNGTENCSLCGPTPVLQDIKPIYDTAGQIPPNMTCGDFDALASGIPEDSDVCSIMSFFYPQCCDGLPTYLCETNVRKRLFQQQEYDPNVPPILSSYREKLKIHVWVEYQTVEEIDVQKGTATIFVTISLIWNDPRLAWNIDSETCADIISVKASNDVEKTEVWAPDFDLFNQIEGVHEFPDVRAHVNSDGTVEWVRSGSLRAICQFNGLAKIPFDTLGCQTLLGPRERLGYRQLEYHLIDGGLGFGQFEPIYNEYTVVPEMAESGRTADSSVVFFTFFFRRAKNYYVFNIVIPTIILTYLSFGTFLLDLRIGERLSYGMALALVVVAQQIVTGDLIPVSNERLWIDKFVGWSFYWVIFGLIESVSLGYLFFLRQDHTLLQSSEPRRAERKAAQGLESQYPIRPIDEGDYSGRETSYDGRDISSDHETSYGGRETSGGAPGQEIGSPEHPSETLRQKFRKTKHPDDAPPIPPGRGFQSDNGSGVQQPAQSVGSVPNETEPAEHDSASQRLSPRFIFKIPLRKIDHFCFLFTTITYTSYILAMFLSIDRWGENADVDFFGPDDPLLGLDDDF